MHRVRFWSRIDRLLRSGENVFAALVVQHTLHSPGTTGARMIVTTIGETEGTIGGGAMEFVVVKRGREVVKSDDFEPEIHHLYHRDQAPGEKSGMICAGEQINLYYLFRPEKDGEVVETISRVAHSDSPGTATFKVSGLSLDKDGGLEDDCQFTLVDADTSEWAFREQLMSLKRVAVVGGGHCGLALSRQLYQLGYDVLLFETRRDLATFDDNTFARSKTIVPDYEEAASLIRHPEHTDVVVMTTDFPSDIAALRGLAGTGGFRSIGLMGSPAKISRIGRELRASGVPDTFVESLRAPIGLPIHSNTPEEIAVSVAAQIVRDRNAEGRRE